MTYVLGVISPITRRSQVRILPPLLKKPVFAGFLFFGLAGGLSGRVGFSRWGVEKWELLRLSREDRTIIESLNTP